MMTKIEMQAMDAVIGIHREMRKMNEPDWENGGMRLPRVYCLILRMVQMYGCLPRKRRNVQYIMQMPLSAN